MRLTRLWLLAAVTSAAGGCAGTLAVAPAATYRYHATQDDVTVHWSLTRLKQSVRATGIVETTGPPIGSVTLELAGLDAAGQVLSRSVTTIDQGFDQDEPQPFTVLVRPTGREQRFEVRVVRYQELTDPWERPRR